MELKLTITNSLENKCRWYTAYKNSMTVKVMRNDDKIIKNVVSLCMTLCF